MISSREELVINVTEHGVDPTGMNDVSQPLQKLIDDAPSGSILYFPVGNYWSDPAAAIPGHATVTVRGKSLTLAGDGVLNNVTFDFTGKCSDLMPIQDGAQRGAIECILPPELQAKPGDLLQFLSSVSAYTNEAGSLRAAGPSPSTGILYSVPFSEFARVHTSGPSSILGSALKFPYPITDAPSLVRLVKPAGPLVVRGLTFDVSALRRFSTLRLDLCADVTIEGCTFVAGETAGRQVQTRDCLNVRVQSNRSTRMPAKEAKGAGWNSFLFGAGTQDVLFTDNIIEGDRQAFDVTSFDGGHPGSVNLSGPRTSNRIVASRNSFSICHDALTSHPGTYFVSFCDNLCAGVSTGIRLRSNTSTVTGNQIESARAGMTLSCYLGDTVISGNTIRKMPMPRYPGVWVGVEWIPLTGEAWVESMIGQTLIQGNIVAGDGPSDRLFYGRTYPLLRKEGRMPAASTDGSSICFVNNALRGGVISIEEELMPATQVHGNFGEFRCESATA